MHWDDIVKDMMNKKVQNKPYSFLGSNQAEYIDENNLYQKPSRGPLKIYSLGAKYGTAYFTKREAECMVWLLKGKTINKVAKKLNLSPRTVEFYLKNMKIKLGCRTKFELIDLVYDSEFMSSIDF